MKVLRTVDWQFIKGRLEIDAVQSRADAMRHDGLAQACGLHTDSGRAHTALGQEFRRLAEWSDKLALDLAEMYDLD